jgi:putative cell wall-binding protein
VHAQPAAAFSFNRYQGSDRYATAAAIAEGAFPSGSGSVVIASGSSFPDALAASYLAGYIAGPVLLTSPTSLSSATSAALTKLKATKVYLVGGTAAVSASVQAQIAALAASGGGTIAVTRVSGSSRYDTDEAIATLPPVSQVGNVDGEKTAIVASGANFPDALALGALAGSKHEALLLTASPTDPGVGTTAWLHTNGSKLTGGDAAGGPSALTDSLLEELLAAG